MQAFPTRLCGTDVRQQEAFKQVILHSLFGSGLASFLVFLKGLKLVGFAFGVFEGKAGSLLGSEAPGRESQRSLELDCAGLRWRLACRLRTLITRTSKDFVLCICIW